MTAPLSIEGVSADIGDTGPRRVVERVSLRLDAGQIGCLLGPSGGGKTTLLRCVAGFHRISEGVIRLGGAVIESAAQHVAPERRQIGMMFQDYALFPHLTAEQNIAFGVRKLPAAGRRERVGQLLELTAMTECARRYPHELSGGQQQRIALARALAPRPGLLLLDEPFSNLDAELKLQLAGEIRDILRRENITALFITHDQSEALAMPDMLGVMRGGRMLQWDTAYNIYHRPVSRETATFVGMGAMLKGAVSRGRGIDTALGRLEPAAAGGLPAAGAVLAGLEDGARVSVLIRPDDIVHDDASGLRAVIEKKQFRGAEFLYHLRLESGETVHCFAPSHHDHQLGEAIGIRLDIEHLVVFR
ncbi:MAG: ABC transporter ATP-binding protein [Gammaproteobacteria bacterium]|nr:ABC transporter ATP-binding protein [Gammaproteobacteria bacterium]